jgi:ATP synthase, F1 delta subunit
MKKNFDNSSTYAKVIFSLAKSNSQLLCWQKALSKFSDLVLLSGNPSGLDSPFFSKVEKISWFEELVTDFPLAINLIRLLVDRRKLYLIPKLTEKFNRLVDDDQGILEVEVCSPVELNDTQYQSLTSALTKKYRREIRLKLIIDHSLIGGLLLRIKGIGIIDGSVKNQLRRLKQFLFLEGLAC